MTDAGALMAELHELRQRRISLRGRTGRRDQEELQRLTRRELTIEAVLLPRASLPALADEGRELGWWQK